MTLATAAGFAVAAWPLNEVSGTRADQVGSNDLADNNTVAQGTGKVNANCADFESANSEFLSIASNSDLQMGDIDFMIRCWINFESTSIGGNIIVGKDTNTPANSRDYTLDLANGVPRLYINGGGGGLLVQWGSALSTGTWYLIHAWHDATNNLLGIAVNAGTAVTANTSGTAPQVSSAQFRIGSRQYSGESDYFDGLIDDVVLLKSYILDATERTEDYNGGTGVAFADWDAGGGGTVSPNLLHSNLLRSHLLTGLAR